MQAIQGRGYMLAACRSWWLTVLVKQVKRGLEQGAPAQEGWTWSSFSMCGERHPPSTHTVCQEHSALARPA